MRATKVFTNILPLFSQFASNLHSGSGWWTVKEITSCPTSQTKWSQLLPRNLTIRFSQLTAFTIFPCAESNANFETNLHTNLSIIDRERQFSSGRSGDVECKYEINIQYNKMCNMIRNHINGSILRYARYDSCSIHQCLPPEHDGSYEEEKNKHSGRYRRYHGGETTWNECKYVA